jgi:hypothetical protein
MALRGAVNGTDAVDPGVRRIITAIEASSESLAVRAVEAIWEQVPAYAASSDERLRDGLGAHVSVVIRALLTSLSEGRPARREDFPITRTQATDRVGQGIALADFLRAFRVGQLTLWDGVLDAARDDPLAREAALSVVRQVMHVIEVGSVLAAEAYLEAQQYRLAESDRLRRDLLEDLLAHRDVPPGPRQSMLRAAGLEPDGGLLVASAALAVPAADEHALRDIAVAVRRTLTCGSSGFAVVRQDEIVCVLPVRQTGPATIVNNLERAVADLTRQHVRLAVGISTVYAGLREVPKAYAEACAARDSLANRHGVVALSRLSTFDYLVLRDDETARRLIRPELQAFVTEDAAKGSVLRATLEAYVASDLNAKEAARCLHVHVNTAYYRLERIAERTGCDLRRFTDVQELLIAVRLLGDRPATGL